MSKLRDYQSWKLKKLSNPTFAANYLNEIEKTSPELVLAAIQNVVKAREVASVAREAGVARENIYRAFSEQGNPTVTTFRDVLRAVGIKITFEAAANVSDSVGSVGGTKPASSLEIKPEKYTINNDGMLTEGYYPVHGILHFGEPASGIKPLEFVNISSLATTRCAVDLATQQSRVGNVRGLPQPVGYVDSPPRFNYFREEPRTALAPQFAQA